MSTGRQSALDIQIRGDSKQRSAALQWATPGLYRGLPPPVLNIECGLYAVCTEVLRHLHPSVCKRLQSHRGHPSASLSPSGAKSNKRHCFVLGAAAANGSEAHKLYVARGNITTAQSDGDGSETPGRSYAGPFRQHHKRCGFPQELSLCYNANIWIFMQMCRSSQLVFCHQCLSGL